MTNKAKYAGILNKPMRSLEDLYDDAGLRAGSSGADRAELQQRVQGLLIGEIAPRMWELLTHYGIDHKDKNCYQLLAFCLAKDHVPGFKQKRTRKRHKKWSELLRAELKADVDSCVTVEKSKNHSASIKHACALLAKDKGKRWMSLLKGLDNPTEALRKQYNNCKKDSPFWVDFVESARANRPSRLIQEAFNVTNTSGLPKLCREV